MKIVLQRRIFGITSWSKVNIKLTLFGLTTLIKANSNHWRDLAGIQIGVLADFQMLGAKDSCTNGKNCVLQSEKFPPILFM